MRSGDRQDLLPVGGRQQKDDLEWVGTAFSVCP